MSFHRAVSQQYSKRLRFYISFKLMHYKKGCHSVTFSHHIKQECSGQKESQIVSDGRAWGKQTTWCQVINMEFPPKRNSNSAAQCHSISARKSQHHSATERAPRAAHSAKNVWRFAKKGDHLPLCTIGNAFYKPRTILAKALLYSDLSPCNPCWSAVIEGTIGLCKKSKIWMLTSWYTHIQQQVLACRFDKSLLREHKRNSKAALWYIAYGKEMDTHTNGTCRQGLMVTRKRSNWGVRRHIHAPDTTC